ncbi:unnamed protein product [Prorocentrum cordatum]|uniref:Uncharacterized protein n=1 Tax=Prorocentrum cordatum TaxID=2364126 RepID=A0ABN9RNU2_9DINO|nr:unnamed protein product [Polarella glacialis]
MRAASCELRVKPTSGTPLPSRPGPLRSRTVQHAPHCPADAICRKLLEKILRAASCELRVKSTSGTPLPSRPGPLGTLPMPFAGSSWRRFCELRAARPLAPRCPRCPPLARGPQPRRARTLDASAHCPRSQQPAARLAASPRAAPAAQETEAQPIAERGRLPPLADSDLPARRGRAWEGASSEGGRDVVVVAADSVERGEPRC